MAVGRRRFVGGMLLIPALVTGYEETASASPAAKARPLIDLRAYRQYLEERAAAGLFSGAVLVAQDGRPLLYEAYGMADRDHGIANTPRTKFCIASMGKMFTAVAITRLVGHGKLAFTDTIGKYVPGFPPAIADQVTIDQLLTHTSGMDDAALRPSPNTPPPTTIAEMMERIVAAPLQFQPGSRFGYSNDGFIVLGAIIEHVTGASYADYVHEHVFRPADMTDTQIRVYTPDEIPAMAHGYTLVGQDGQPLPPGTLRDDGDTPQIGNPSGGAYSTVTDMLRFARAVTGYRLLSPALTDTMLAGKVDAQRLGGPPGEKYAYGFDDESINGIRIVGHNGGTPGYEGQLDIYPDTGYTVVILTNQDGVLVPAIQKSEQILTT